MDISSESSTSFSKWRTRLWPIHRSEHRKFIPLLLIKFLVSFVYTILHATKDTLIVTSKGSGAEAIPLLKGGVVIVFACLAMLLYSKLSNLLSKKRLFYTFLTLFIFFFTIFGFVLYPLRELLSPTASSDALVNWMGADHQHWVAIYRWWFNSLFFVMAELWGGVVILVLFWGFANQVCSVGEASRFYTLFAIGSNAGVIAAGPLIWSASHWLNGGNYELTIKWMMSAVAVTGILIALLYYWVNEKIVDVDQQKTVEKKKKKSTSLIKSLVELFSSSSLVYIAMMVIGYSLAVNMVEVIWKATLKLQFPKSVDYQAFMGVVSFSTGCLALLLSLFVGGNLMRKFGWYAASLSTPLVLGLTSLFFFTLYYMGYNEGGFTPELLYVAVLVGAVHNICCKSMKYSLFDPTKEMAYIPLSEDEKVKGKAAVDMVASRFGKSGSSWIQAALIEIAGVGSVLNIGGFLAPCVIIAILFWVFAVRKMRGEFTPQAELIAA